MSKARQRYDGAFKARVALEAIKGDKTLAEITSRYKVHSSQILKWKKQVLTELPKILSDRRSQQEQDNRKLEEELYKQIGQLTVELDWLKKKSGQVY